MNSLVVVLGDAGYELPGYEPLGDSCGSPSLFKGL